MWALQLGISWAIAGSRIVDNKHHPSDVVAGFVLGASVAVIFLLRSIPCARCAPKRSCNMLCRTSSSKPAYCCLMSATGQLFLGNSLQ